MSRTAAWAVVALGVVVGVSLALVTRAQESGPSGPGPWSVVQYVASVVEAAPPKRSDASVIPIHNSGEVKVLVLSFSTIDECNTARNGPLNPSGFSMLLGTGNQASAHIGRAVSECFKQ